MPVDQVKFESQDLAMGYTTIFTILEKPIRDYIKTYGQTESLIADVGLKTLRAACHARSARRPASKSLSLFTSSVPCIIPFRQFHDTESELLFWSARRFVMLAPPRDPMALESWIGLDRKFSGPNRITHVPKDDRDEILRSSGRAAPYKDPLSDAGHTSHYALSDDAAAAWMDEKEADWPVLAMGKAVLGVMMSSWLQAAPLVGKGGAVRRCCTLLVPEACIFLWQHNALRVLSCIDESTKAEVIRVSSRDRKLRAKAELEHPSKMNRR